MLAINPCDSCEIRTGGLNNSEQDAASHGVGAITKGIYVDAEEYGVFNPQLREKVIQAIGVCIAARYTSECEYNIV